VSDLIILRDLPDGKNKTRKGFREWSHCSGRSTNDKMRGILQVVSLFQENLPDGEKYKERFLLFFEKYKDFS